MDGEYFLKYNRIKMGNAFKFLLEYNEYIKNIEYSNLDEYIYDEILHYHIIGNFMIYWKDLSLLKIISMNQYI